MLLLALFAPPTIWYLSKESLPRISKFCGFVSLLLVSALFLNAINSI